MTKQEILCTKDFMRLVANYGLRCLIVDNADKFHPTKDDEEAYEKAVIELNKVYQKIEKNYDALYHPYFIESITKVFAG